MNSSFGSALSAMKCGRHGREDEPIISTSPIMRDAIDRVQRVAPTDTTVLLTGETGTGKELIARCLHRQSRRASRPFVAVNLAALPETLIATELFGHEPGAFTGATQRRIGRFETADGATLFLDEIGELSSEMQVALLRVVQEGEFERLGASQTRHVDVRLIAATNRRLDEAVDHGAFRADLFYRVSVFPIHLPPLRERREDILPMAECFLSRLAGRLGRRLSAIDEESQQRLLEFSWPGNIRQLQNVIEHSAILCDQSSLRIPASLLVEKSDAPGGLMPATLLKGEQAMIERALEQAGGRVAGASGAAARLGVPASTLESKIKRFNIDKAQFRVPQHAAPPGDGASR